MALRELMANMLIHQDFSITGTGPMICIFDGRIEFTNPGSSLVDVARLLNDPPHSRNEKMAAICRRLTPAFAKDLICRRVEPPKYPDLLKPASVVIY